MLSRCWSSHVYVWRDESSDGIFIFKQSRRCSGYTRESTDTLRSKWPLRSRLRYGVHFPFSLLTTRMLRLFSAEFENSMLFIPCSTKNRCTSSSEKISLRISTFYSFVDQSCSLSWRNQRLTILELFQCYKSYPCT